MPDEIYEHIILQLSSFLGNPSDLPSGNGTRFKDQSQLVLTVYHSNISQDNAAEIAVKPEAIATSYGYTEHQMQNHINAICGFTAYPIKPDPKYNWPRVGIRSIDEADQVVTYLAGINASQAHHVPDA